MILPGVHTLREGLYFTADICFVVLDISQTTTQTSSTSSPPATEETESHMDLEAPIRPMSLQGQPKIFQVRVAKHFKIAGMSRDCRQTFFHDTKRVVVLETSLLLESAPGQLAQMSHNPYTYVEGHKNTIIERVALAGRWLTICTNQELIILQTRTQPNRALEMLRKSHGEWEPTGLAIYEHDGHLVLLLGQRMHNGVHFQGRVSVFRIEQTTDLPSSLTEPDKYFLLENDFPKDVDISFDGTLILCRTELHNSVVLWEMVSQPGSDQRSLKIARRCHTPVSISHLPHPLETHSFQLNSRHPGDRTCRNYIYVYLYIVQ